MRATSLDEHSVVIAISLTGGKKEIVHTVKETNEKNATVIVLTNYVNSSLVKYADYMTSVKESPLDSGSLVAGSPDCFLPHTAAGRETK